MRVRLECFATTALLAFGFVSSTAFASSASHRIEVLICPPSHGDLDYVMDAMVREGGMEEDPSGRRWSYRRLMTKNPSWLPALRLKYLYVRVRDYHTSEGTRLVAELTVRDTYEEKPLTDKRLIGAFNESFQKLASAWKCPT